MAGCGAPGGCRRGSRTNPSKPSNPYTREETTIVLESHGNRTGRKLAGELGTAVAGTVLFADGQRGRPFSVADGLAGSLNKLVDRHPHVFGEVKSNTPAEVLRQLEALKGKRKRSGLRRGDGNDRRRAIGDSGGSSKNASSSRATKLSFARGACGLTAEIEGLFASSRRDG